MGPFEYLLMFASVILALALSDVVISFNRLLGAGPRVRWDWLAPLAALVAFLKIVTQWWAWFAGKAAAAGMTYGMFLGILVSAVLLFLMSAATLPDALEADGVELRAYWERVGRRFWALFVGHWLVATATSIWVQMAVEGARLGLAWPALLVLPAALLPALVRRRWLDGLALGGFLLLYAAGPFGHRLVG